MRGVVLKKPLQPNLVHVPSVGVQMRRQVFLQYSGSQWDGHYHKYFIVVLVLIIMRVILRMLLLSLTAKGTHTHTHARAYAHKITEHYGGRYPHGPSLITEYPQVMNYPKGPKDPIGFRMLESTDY